jgi:cob(I)alamin adenosyltransferase
VIDAVTAIGQEGYREFMKIYTKGGDKGETGLFGGDRVPKDHLRIRAYGTLDELNAALGMALADCSKESPLYEPIIRIQSELFVLGSELATPRGKSLNIHLIGEAETHRLETEIDSMEAKLPPLKAFILPGGTRLSSALHLARTISRRAERETVVLNRSEPLRAEAMGYLNRLSDYFFVCARFANHEAGVADVPWKAPRVPAL